MINYVDCGLHEGNEIAMFLAHVGPEVECRVLGIEANPQYADYCRQRFQRHPRVEIYNFAVASRDGECELYLDGCGEGSSIYADKRGVDPVAIRVPCRRLSRWLVEQRVLPKQAGHVNVLRANIEGAEWDLLQDFAQNGCWPHFDIVLGAGWVTDMQKVPSLEPHINEALGILENHRVRPEIFVGPSRSYDLEPLMKRNVDLGRRVKELVKDDPHSTSSASAAGQTSSPLHHPQR